MAKEPVITLDVYLDSGQTIRAHVTNWKATKEGSTLVSFSWEWDDRCDRVPRHLHVDNIVGIVEVRDV